MVDTKFIWVIIIGAILLLVYINRGSMFPFRDSVSKDEGVTMRYVLFDKGMNPVFSVVGGQEVEYINVYVDAFNTGESVIESSIIDASPIDFNLYIPLYDVKNINPGGNTSWGALLMPTSLFENYPQPTVFWVKVKGIYVKDSEEVREYIEGNLTVDIKKSPGTPCNLDKECWSGVCI